MAIDPDNVKTFTITPTQFAEFRTLATQNGVTMDAGNIGQAKDPAYDVVMGFSYDGVSKLTLTLVSDAWYEPDSTVWGTIEKYLD